MSNLSERIEWIDQVKGFGIFLVVYGHNFPVIEKYIYGFHMPLFFIIAGFFHPPIQQPNSILKRFKSILIPYFIWSFLLFTFWLLLGRFYGDSINYNLSIFKNFIGIFYAQGGRDYMDWGIPMWFLPTLFLTFILFYLIKCIKSQYQQFLVLFIVSVLGFVIPHLFKNKLVWSFDVALVALIFYAIGFFSKNVLINLNKMNSWFLTILFGVLYLLLFNFNEKIDMYRSIYGNELIFIINGVTGSVFYLLLFKNIPIFKFFGFLGKSTIPILALQLRSLTFIKFCMLLFIGIKVYNFTETEKITITIIQISLLIPILICINKYIPILNGDRKKV